MVLGLKKVATDIESIGLKDLNLTFALGLFLFLGELAGPGKNLKLNSVNSILSYNLSFNSILYAWL